MKPPFEYGASYRVRRSFEAFRDDFEAGELLFYVDHATSIRDDMEGFFFRQPGSRRLRSWDIPLGDDANEARALFDLVAGPDPLILACSARDAAGARAALASDTSDTYLLVIELALKRGIAMGSTEITELLLPRLGDSALRVELLHHAARSGRAGPVSVLLDAGIPVDAEDGAGQTPLFHAATSGDIATVELLLANGANPKHRRPDGTTPLVLARAWQHRAVVEALERSER